MTQKTKCIAAVLVVLLISVVAHAEDPNKWSFEETVSDWGEVRRTASISGVTQGYWQLLVSRDVPMPNDTSPFLDIPDITLFLDRELCPNYMTQTMRPYRARVTWRFDNGNAMESYWVVFKNIAVEFNPYLIKYLNASYDPNLQMKWGTKQFLTKLMTANQLKVRVIDKCGAETRVIPLKGSSAAIKQVLD